MGAKKFLEYLSSQTGEGHDTAVYDTGYEFDIHSPAAVRFVASVAMAKASGGTESFPAEMPQDGSVVPIGSTPQNKDMLLSVAQREERERSCPMVYIPDSSRYCELVQNALQYRHILAEDMTEEEKADFQKTLKEAERSNTKYMLLHYYLPTAFALLTLIYVIYKLAQ